MNHVPGPARRWVRVLLGIGVSVAVGLAPWLGKTGVPGFSALLSLFPDALRDAAIPLSSFLMGVVAAFVQYFDHRSRVSPVWFTVTGTVCVVGILALAVLWKQAVTVVEFPDIRTTYVTGFGARPPECCRPLHRGERVPSDAECVLGLADPNFIRSCFGEDRIRRAELALLGAYLLCTTVFGALVGLLVLRGAGPADQASPVDGATRRRRDAP